MNIPNVYYFSEIFAVSILGTLSQPYFWVISVSTPIGLLPCESAAPSFHMQARHSTDMIIQDFCSSDFVFKASLTHQN